MLYQKVDRTFKEGAYVGQYRPNQMKNASPYIVAPILKKVIEEMIEAKAPFRLQQNFCLVNVYSPDNEMSMGYSGIPDPSLIMIDSGLVFTFCLKARQNRTLPAPVQSIGMARYWRLWGEKNANEYLTICVPRSYAFALNGNGIEFLNVLYNTIGMVTRNYVQTVTSPAFTPAYVSHDLSTMADMLRDQTAQHVVRNIPYNEWQYSLEIWKRHSVCLSPDLLDKNFPLYYLMYLSNSLYLPDLGKTATEYVETKVVDFLSRGFMKMSATLATGYPEDSAELYAALYALVGEAQDASEMEANQVGRVNFTRAFFYKLMQNFQNLPEYQSKIVQYLSSNHNAMAKAFVTGSYNEQLKNLIAYINLTEV